MTSANDNQKKIWKKEAEQLKKDLENRQKKVQRRPVAIQFGQTNKKKPSAPPPPIQQGFLNDSQLRAQLGIDSVD